mgnify:CR=1 FL=1
MHTPITSAPPVPEGGDTTTITAYKIALRHPADVSGLVRLITSGAFAADDVVAVVGKTSGSGDLDDSSRLDADLALRTTLREYGTRSAEEIQALPMVFSTGGIGLLEPNAVLFVRTRSVADASSEPRLSIGIAQTHPLSDADVGRLTTVNAVADSVRRAAAMAQIPTADARYVLLKSRMPERRGGAAGAVDTKYDMQYTLRTSGAASLGAALALGDVTPPDETDIGENLGLWSARVSSSTGKENPETQVILLGNRVGAGGNLRVGSAAMEDALDVRSLGRAIRDAGLDVPDTCFPEEIRRRIVAVFVKCSAPEGDLRGHYQVPESLNPQRIDQVKAAIAGAFASAIGAPAIYISAAAIHQGPPGGGNVAVIVDVSDVPVTT